MAQAIRLSVKGSREQASAQLAARGLRGEFVSEGRFGSTYWDVPAHARAAVVSWFCEPASCSEQSGFPDGTLLHHG